MWVKQSREEHCTCPTILNSPLADRWCTLPVRLSALVSARHRNCHGLADALFEDCIRELSGGLQQTRHSLGKMNFVIENHNPIHIRIVCHSVGISNYRGLSRTSLIFLSVLKNAIILPILSKLCDIKISEIALICHPWPINSIIIFYHRFIHLFL